MELLISKQLDHSVKFCCHFLRLLLAILIILLCFEIKYILLDVFSVINIQNFLHITC